MSRSKRMSAARLLPPFGRALGLAAAAATAGCSADVTRFDLLGGNFLGTTSGYPSSATQTSYAPAAPPRGRPPGGWDSAGLQESSLPPVSPGPQDYRVPGREYPSSAQLPPRTEAVARAPDRAPPWSEGDRPPWTDRDPAPWMNGPDARPRTASVTAQPQAWQGRYVMKSGESLYAIAHRHKVSVEELKRVNGITDASKVWAGKVLLVPGSAATAAASAAPNTPPRVVQVAPRIVSPTAESRADPEPPVKSARHTGTMSDAEPAAMPAPTPAAAPPPVQTSAPAAAAGRFRWPVRGKVIAGFGMQADGSKNEGINVAVPMGTEIHAAETGRVHYAGDGLKGYGNLILIRHPNGWVSAYAHADQMLVKAGDEVKRGQVIGKAGMTGPVAQPQLLFELRKGSVPVDPLPHLVN